MFHTQYFAHRGLHSPNITENTMEAFEAAVNKKYGIELDVHLSRDGKIVVYHDYSFSKLCNDNRYVSATDYKDIAKIKTTKNNQQVSLLEDVLDLVNGKVSVIVEIKDLFPSQALCNEIVKIEHNYKGQVSFKSFNHDFMDQLKIFAPHIYCGKVFSEIITDTPVSQQLAIINGNEYFKYDKMNFLSVHWSDLNYNFISLMKRHKKQLITWTVTDASKAASLLEVCDGIMFEQFEPHLI